VIGFYFLSILYKKQQFPARIDLNLFDATFDMRQLRKVFRDVGAQCSRA